MDPDRYRRSKEIFDAVCNRPKDERAAAVAIACGNDRMLESDVLAMLQVDDDSRFFDATAIERFERSMRESAASEFPRTIGPYEILGVLGTGGMGVVFRARQASPRRDVALKVMNGLGKGSDARRRFDLEGHFLARLNHEGIARIFEVGEAETVLGKEPYIAMELVEGPTLLEYAEAHRLDVRARLLLIARIADAVEHAHQKGLIHRDLKPGNILVTADGQPKILDFGIARTIGEASDSEAMTRTGSMIGTIAYMSPERLTAALDAADTRADVYSLGVILYRLLSGRLPYAVEGMSLPESIAAICEKDPPALGVVGGAFPDDVEIIAETAIRKERERRYQSAAALAADIRRHLADEAILARPVTAAYAARKFARRHRLLVSSTAVILAVILGALGVSLKLYRKAVQAGDVAEAKRVEARAAEGLAESRRTEAERERNRAVAINDFVMRFIWNASPVANPEARATTLAEALAAATKRVAEEFKNDPEVAASLHEQLGRTLTTQGRFADAAQSIEAARAAMVKLYGRSSQRVADVLCLQGENFLEMHEVEDADDAFSDALKVVADSTVPAARRTAAHAKSGLALARALAGKASDAKRLGRESIDLMAALCGAESKDLLGKLSTMAQVCLSLNDAPAALPYLERAVAIRKANGLGEDYGHAEILNLLGVVYSQTGRIDLAESRLREAIEVQTKVYGESDYRVGMSWNNLALTLANARRLADCETCLRKGLKILTETLPDPHPNVAQCLFNLAMTRRDLGDPAEAEKLLRRAIEIRARCGPTQQAVPVVEMQAALDRLLAARAADSRPADDPGKRDR